MNLKNSLTIVFLLSISVGFAQTRQKQSFNDNWKFSLTDSSVYQKTKYDDSNWRVLDLPHDWSVEGEFSKNNSGRNAFLPGGCAWYRKTFDLPERYEGKSIEIQFDGVYKNAKLWVNNILVGTQHDGYTSFRIDITELLNPKKVNTIALRVDNSNQPNCRWYTGSGIYRNVWLNVTNQTHVETWGTFITTPEVTNQEASIKIMSTIRNMDEAGEFFVKTEIYNPEGLKVAEETSPVLLGNYQSTDITQQLRVDAPQRWSLDMPAMYTATTSILRANEIIDEYSSSFGIRTLEFDADKGFFLNGENLKMKGVCLHHDGGSLGGAVPDEVWVRRLQNLKAIGCNAIRTAHNPASPEFMTMCDTIGFLVMNEFVDKWDAPYPRGGNPNDNFLNNHMADPNFSVEWEKNYAETIRRDRNHPSVIIWSVGNENYPAGAAAQNHGLRKYASFVRSLDPTRPVISGMERGGDKDPAQKADDIIESCEFMDLIALNYGEQWVKDIVNKKPGKAFVSTESYRYFNSTPVVRYSRVESSPWIDVIENDQNMGLFLWPGIAYLGERRGWGGIGSIGLLNFAGFRETDSYLYEAFWSDKPMVHLEVYDNPTNDLTKMSQWGQPATHQNWNLPKGSKVNVISYTNCETVDLYLNDKKIATQKLADFPNWLMKWNDISYQPGELKAVGKIDGKAVCESSIITSGKLHQISIIADKQKVKEGDIVHIELFLQDKKGRHINNLEQELYFEIEGDVEIIALENGDSNDMTPFTNKENRLTHEGKCLCIIKVGNNIDKEISLTVKSEGIKDQRLVFETKN